MTAGFPDFERNASMVFARFSKIFAYSVTLFAVQGAVALGPAKWISGDSAEPYKPAPVLVKEFKLDSVPANAVFAVAVAGWCEVKVNGRKVGKDVLSPVTCQPDKRIPSLDLEVARFLREGTNVLEVLLGNGWQNTFTKDSWGFCEAPWMGSPKIRGELRCDGKVVFVTDGTWRAYDSPIVFNALRNGEWYDARREGERINERPATVERYAPWGRVCAEDAVPCSEGEVFEGKLRGKTPYGHDLYDFGANISGWCEIEVEGERGSKVTLDYDESLDSRGWLLEGVKRLIRGRGESRPVMHDEYTLAGRPDGERWHPRFTYHGFRYVAVAKKGNVKLKSIRARFVHSGFRRAGTITMSEKTFSALQAATERSYLSNFVGIPTDCPHREKNGWTGDAQLAMETGLWNFDAKAGYVHFLRMMLDSQRPNGAVACILPCTPKFGFGWGSGPAWDAALFEIPWQIYRFYGDDAPAREAYPAMKRYLAFISEKADADGLVAYGLGDWCNYQRRPSASVRLTDSAYVYEFNRRAAFWAELFGEKDYAAERTVAAEQIKAAFNRVFYKGDGLYENGHLTALAAPLYFKGLCAEGEEERVARRLVAAVREKSHRAYFGILGAKWVPRVLADYGYADDAFKMFIQPEMPGWARWLQFGDGTLREDWDDYGSHNHVMFGDLSAWAYEYAVGIVPLEPGFRKVAFRPHFINGVDAFSAAYNTPFGEIRAGWKRVDGKPVFEYSVPQGVEVENSVRAGADGHDPIKVSVRRTPCGPRVFVGDKPVWPRFFYGSPTCLCNISGKRKAVLKIPFASDRDTSCGRVVIEGYPGVDPLWFSDAKLVDITAGTTNVVLSAEDEVNVLRYEADNLRFAKNHKYHFIVTHRATRPRTYFTIGVTYSENGITTGLPYYYGDTLGDTVALAAAADVDLVTFSTDSSWGCEGWWNPPEQPEDYSKIDREFERLIEINPDVLLVPRIMTDAPAWMHERHPEIRMSYKPHCGLVMSSVSSRIYRRAACEAVEKLSRHLRSKYPRHYAGLQISGQNSAEWFYMLSQSEYLSGYDAGTKQAFREWLKDRGVGDWAVAEVPTPEERRASPPSPRALEFARFRQREMASFLVELGAAAKRGSCGEALTLFFYGYSWELGGVLAAETGHFDFGWLLKNAQGKIDGFSSPLGYRMRNLTGSTVMMSAAESIMRNGYLWFNEIDHRTHLEEMWDHMAHFKPYDDPEVTREILLRDSAAGILRGYGDWWMDLFGRGWHRDAGIWKVREELNRLDDIMAQRKQPYSPQIASVVHEDSFLRVGQDVGRLKLLNQKGFATCGADYGQYLLDDILENPPKSVKLFYFPVLRQLASGVRSKIDALKASRPDAVFVEDVTVRDITAEAIASRAREAGVHCYTEPGAANICSADGVVLVQALREGNLAIDFGSHAIIRDALSGDFVCKGPKTVLPFRLGETRLFRVGEL